MAKFITLTRKPAGPIRIQVAHISFFGPPAQTGATSLGKSAVRVDGETITVEETIDEIVNLIEISLREPAPRQTVG